MAQAQFRSPHLDFGTDVCNACYVVYNFFERVPKLLHCGHFFCLQCVRCMRREDVILCFFCGHPTPSPRDLMWLPTRTDRVFIYDHTWRIPGSKPKPVIRETAKLRHFPGHSTVWPRLADFAQGNLENGNRDAFVSNGMPQVVSGLTPSIWHPSSVGASGSAHQANESIYSAPTADGTSGEQRSTEIGVPLGPTSTGELLYGLVLPHHGVSKDLSLLWNDPADHADASIGVRSQSSDPVFTSDKAWLSQDLPRGEADGQSFLPPHKEFLVPSTSSNRFDTRGDSVQSTKRWIENVQIKHDCPPPPLLNGLPWYLQTSFPVPTSEHTVKVNRMTRELKGLIETLEIATSKFHSHGRWVFTCYLQEEGRQVHRNLLDFQKEETFTRPLNFMLNQQGTPSQPNSPYFGLDIISDIKVFLMELQRMAGNDKDENTIFDLCTILIFQRYKAFLEENFRLNQGSRLVPATTRRDNDLNDDLTVSRPLAGVQTQPDRRNVPMFPEGHNSQRSCSEASNANRKQPDTNEMMEHCYFPFNLTTRDTANIYYMDFKIDGYRAGRVVIEIHPAMTPLMAANFAVLCSRTSRSSFKGCRVFQTWNRQSIISGDTETNTGNGGRSILHDDFFEPDPSSLPAVRGTIGMRRLARNPRAQKGKVSSQFRILLNKQPKITGMFGHIISGIEVVDKISQLDDGKGNPRKRVFISDCGKLVFD